MVQTSYSDRMPIAHVGQISDTSPHNIDGATAATADVRVGVPVIYTAGDNDTKSVREIATGETFKPGSKVGVSVFSHYANYKGAYQKGEPVNVMRSGRIMVRTLMTTAPAIDAALGFNFDDDKGPVAAVGGAVTVPGWSFTGVHGTGPDGDYLVEIEVVIPQFAAAAGA